MLFGVIVGLARRIKATSVKNKYLQRSLVVHYIVQDVVILLLPGLARIRLRDIPNYLPSLALRDESVYRSGFICVQMLYFVRSRAACDRKSNVPCFFFSFKTV